MSYDNHSTGGFLLLSCQFFFMDSLGVRTVFAATVGSLR